MPKKICGWDKESIKKEWKEFRSLVRDPGYVCEKCGRSASQKKHLCKPRAL